MKDTSFPAYLFHQGTNLYSYEYLGVNAEIFNGRHQYTFRVWAPNADRVGLISDFSGWEHPLFMSRKDNGVFELTCGSDYSLERKPYKFRIFCGDKVFDKGDPYARFSRGGSDGASLIFAEHNFGWTDTDWLEQRRNIIRAQDGIFLSTPINIYEIHLGSFIRHFDNKYYSYRQFAEILPTYLKELGYTHVEFLPIQEHPFDGSWGYQVCGFYAPTSRFGDPDDFRYLIDTLHRNGIGVIMDWVPAHFPSDGWGLHEFDGTRLYEYSDTHKKSASDWGTRFFDLSKPEIHSFLISNALYFLREFHIDGIRVDAVSSIIYFDGGQENPDGINFLRKLNNAIAEEFPDVLTIAEESTAYGKTTLPISSGGLGFSLKWNMGWAHDFYDYMSTAPSNRREKHRALNFPLIYAFSENFCMPISHDEVAHGKRSFIDKMYGDIGDKFSEARLALLLMMTYPGKKLLFMGTEFAQFKEWDSGRELEWFMLQFPNHRQFREYVASLNHFYLKTCELWDIDFDEKGFRWIYPDEAEKNLVAFRRISKFDSEIIIVLNFSDSRQQISIPANTSGQLNVIFDTGNFDGSKYIKIQNSHIGSYADITLPKFSGVILKENN